MDHFGPIDRVVVWFTCAFFWAMFSYWVYCAISDLCGR